MTSSRDFRLNIQKVQDMISKQNESEVSYFRCSKKCSANAVVFIVKESDVENTNHNSSNESQNNQPPKKKRRSSSNDTSVGSPVY